MTGLARPHHLSSRLCGLDPARVAASVTGLNFLTVDTILRKMEQMEISESATVGIWTVVDCSPETAVRISGSRNALAC